MIAPASAPTPAASPNDSAIARRGSMPHSAAASGCAATARIARPRTVRSKNRCAASITARVMPTIQKVCGWIRRPSQSTGVLPEKPGRSAGFLPSTSITRLLLQIATAISTSVTAIGVGRLSRRTIKRSESRPTAITTSTAQRTASTSGKRAAYDVAATMPPIITHSPCAKLIAPVLLKMTLKPSATSA